MLSRVYENDVKEEIKSFNRQKDDGNYIEKAINFNQQQELQKDQTFKKPNLMNQTTRTDANTNTDYDPNLMNQTARTDLNTNTDNASVQTNNLNQSMESATFAPDQEQAVNTSTSITEAVASTPLREQAASISSMTPSPILQTLLKITDSKGNRVCGFCRKTFPSKKTLTEHLNKMHEKHMSRYDQSFLVPIPEDSSDEDSEFFTPLNTITLSENTGAKSAALTPIAYNEPDVTVTEQDSLSKTTSSNGEKSPVVIKFLKRKKEFDNTDNSIPIKKKLILKKQKN